MFERICIILLANLVFFSKTLTYQYTSDDVPVWKDSKDRAMKWWQRRWGQIEGSVRVSPQQDHLLTTFFHAFVAVFVYIMFGANDVSYVAALFFSFNPMNNQGSVWISGRTYATTALLLMASVVSPWLAILAIPAVMYYPIGFIMSAVLVIYNPWLALIIIPSGIYHFARLKDLIGRKKKKEMFDMDRRISPKKLILVLKTYGYYTILALIPVRTTFYHSFMQSMAGAGSKKAYKIDRYFWIGLIFAGLSAYKIFFTPWDMVSFGLLWWAIGLSPFLNAFRLSQEIAERYAYAPLPGLMFVLATILQPYPILVSAVIAMYATKLWFWMDAFQDDFYLVEMSCFADPGAWFAWHVKALKRWDVQSHKEAMILWTMARRISPREFKILFNMATMMKIHGHHEQATKFMNEAEANIPPGQEEQAGILVKEWRGGKHQILV